MKKLMVVLSLVLMMSVASFGGEYPPPHRQVVDSLGNHLVTYEWTKFYFDRPFVRADGQKIPRRPGQIAWVLAKPYEPKRFVGWLTLGGFAAGTIDAYNQGYLQRGWDNWDEVERFWWIAGTPTLWGMALDSKYPDACRWMGGFQGGLGALSIIHHSGWNPTLENAGLAAGIAVGSYAVGWLFDKYRNKPPRNAYRYYIR